MKYLPLPSLISLLLLVLLSSCSWSTRQGEYPHYRISLDLRPTEQYLAAETVLSFVSPVDDLRSASFHLHRQLDVTSVESDLLAEYTIDNETPPGVLWMPEARWLNLAFTRPLSEGERIDITFRYEGTVKDQPPYLANVLTPEWVELGLYLPWFPLNAEYGDFTYELDVSCDPAYEVRSSGPVHRRRGQLIFTEESPVNDIVVVAAPDLKTSSNSGPNLQVQVYYVSIVDSTAVQIGDDLFRSTALYESWFGGTGREHVALIVSPRVSGGGYARTGLIVLGGMDDAGFAANREGYLRYIAHESAHLWWNFASPESWHDWLNEGLAEFSALLAVRELAGPEAFRTRLERKREESADTPPLWGFDRNDSSTPEKSAAIQHNLYDKGPVLLYELYQRLEHDAFCALCHRMVIEQTATTQALLTLLKDISDPETAEWFEDALRTR